MVDRRIDPAALLAEVAHHRNGASVLFVGTVRDMNEGAPVTGLDYSAYGAMAQRELGDIVAEAATRWETTDIVVEHRVGELGLGDVSVAIATAHPHRDQAFEAARYVIEELKRRAPIWKREHYVDGRAVWVAATSSEIENRKPETEPRSRAKAGAT
ncbi:MAG: molybdenum cofactor biosynthesis protein MoaE [Gemmatimonadota bacterium]